MSALTTRQINDVSEAIDSAIDRLLELGVTYRLYEHIIEKNRKNWRELEFDLSVDYPVKAIGIIATTSSIQTNEFLHDEEDVASDEITALVGQLPFDAAMASYAFTIMEICGDDVVSIINPAFSKGKSSWHRSIPANVQSIKDAQKKFAEPFDFDPAIICPSIVTRMAKLKVSRNEFAHRRNADVTFESFLADVLAILCQIYFACAPNANEIKRYPYTDYTGKWA